MENPLVYLVTQLLRLTKIPFDKEELAFQIQSHPSFPSLHAVTGVLEHFNIENLAVEVPKTEEIVHQLPSTFLAQIKLGEETSFATIIKKGEKLDALISSKKKESMTISQFLERFTGVIVAIEKDEDTTVKSKSKTNVKATLSISLGLLIVSLIFISEISLGPILYLILTSIGILISSIILKKDFGLQTYIGDVLCSKSNVKTDCTTVLSSKGASFGNIKLSDISWTYFISLSLATVASMLLDRGFTILLIISIVAIPIIIYSIYYQYAFAKAWCTLCLIIASILGLQALLAVYLLPPVSNIPFEPFMLILFLCICITTHLSWNLASEKILEFISLKQTKLDFYKFKRNFDLFKMLLFRSPNFECNIPNTSEIVFGNKKALLSIVIVSSPFCGHCKSVHKMVENILGSKGDKVAITIRFGVGTVDKENVLYRIIARLTEIYHEESTEKCLKAMHEIYEGKTPKDWFTTWGEYTEDEIYNKTLLAQNQWCIERGVDFTPYIFIEGRPFPKEYNRQDLELFMDDLIELSISRNS